jgi:glycosyltransferase involved in cell wall biosynthesis
MKIDVFTTCYNEELILPYFLRHYSKFARNIIVYDNMSTDGSIKLMKDYNVDIVPFDTGNKFEESKLVEIRNTCWLGSDADWVIICDSDEFIYHDDIIKVLNNTNATHIVTEGYEMMSEELPKKDGQIYDEIKQGFFKPDYSKPCLFKPTEISNINFAPGSHTAKPEGNVISINNSGIKLLHYKYLNREVLIEKYAKYAIRQSEEMKRKGWGNYQQWTPEVLNAQFDSWKKQCNNIID